MERNERLKAADKYASRYTNENEAHIARAAFMLGCEFEAQGEMVKGVILETEEEHWKPSEEQMDILDKVYHYLWADRNATADMQDGLGDFIDELKSL